jgi:hypothetical protein
VVDAGTESWSGTTSSACLQPACRDSRSSKDDCALKNESFGKTSSK